jgi:hypothetical protein
MGDLLALLIPLLGFAAVVSIALSLSKLVQNFRAFHEDYRRVHNLDAN